MYCESENGVRIFYEIEGDGPPLLLIAGTGCDHGWWALQRQAFAQHHTLILCDMRGAGRSTIPSEREAYSSEGMAFDVARVIDAAGLGPVHIAGHSLGSCIAQQVALRHPQLVRSIQLHATWAHADEWLRRGFVGTMAYATERGDQQMAWKTVGMWIFSPDYLETREPQQVADAVAAEFITNPHLDAGDGLLGHLHADGTHDTRAVIHRVAVPTLITAGELDVCIPARYGAWVRDHLPHATWNLFTGPRSAHAYPLEMAEDFNRACLQFLEGVPE